LRIFGISEKQKKNYFFHFLDFPKKTPSFYEKLSKITEKYAKICKKPKNLKKNALFEIS
jgi:hypothetical protein